jgi:glutamyl-tRNA synthetase
LSISKTPIRTRFAPSPSGFLHLGNIRAALFNWLLAKSLGGTMLLRIEDTDANRSGDNYAAAIEDDLSWLGLDWAGTPIQQSQRTTEYNQALQTLLNNEKAYHCFCSPEALKAERARQLQAGQPPRYSGVCARGSVQEAQRRLNNGEPAVVRFRMPATEIEFNDIVYGSMNFDGGDIGDFVLRRADGTFSFFFVNAVDDALCGVTHVLRGADHLANTPRQVALLSALMLKFPTYGHVPLINDVDGRPLSKRNDRDGMSSLRDLRKKGYIPKAIVNYLARLGHTIADNQLLTLAELASIFNTEALSKAPSKYDGAQLAHRQKEATLILDAAEWRSWLCSVLPATLVDNPVFYEGARENIVLFKEAKEWAAVVDAENLQFTEAAQQALADANFYHAALAELQDDMEWKSFCVRVGSVTGKKGRELFLPLRAALTGRTDGPVMGPLFTLIGKKMAHARICQHT